MHTSRAEPHIIDASRLDPEYYHPKHLAQERVLRTFGAKSLGTIGKFFAGPFGSKLPSHLYLAEGIPLFRVSNVGAMEVCLDGMAYLHSSVHMELSASEVVPGDLLIVKASVGEKICKVPDSMPRANITQHIISVRTYGKVDVDYIAAFLFSRYGRGQLVRRSLGSIIQYLGISDAKSVLYPVISLDAQRYIGDKVRLAEQLRELGRVLTANISESMKQCFRGHPRPPQRIHARIASQALNPLRMESEFYAPLALWADEEIKGSQWRHARLADVAVRIKDGPGGWGVSTNDYVTQGVPVIRGVNLIDGECDLSDCVFITHAKHQELRSHCVYHGNVLLSVRGTIGRSAVFDIPEYDEASLNAAVVTIECKDGLLPHYLAEFFNTEIGRIQSERMGNGAVQQNMNLTETGENLVVIPPMDFQAEITHSRQKRLAYARYSAQMIKAARQLVEALIENKLTENELAAAAATLEQGDRTLDRAILARLTEDGLDEEGKRKLFPDFDALYAAIDEAKQAHTDGETS